MTVIIIMFAIYNYNLTSVRSTVTSLMWVRQSCWAVVVLECMSLEELVIVEVVASLGGMDTGG